MPWREAFPLCLDQALDANEVGALSVPPQRFAQLSVPPPVRLERSPNVSLPFVHGRGYLGLA